jgi:hypothetical protein
MEYRVWVSVEACDEEADIYEERDVPFASTAIFETEEAAQAFALELHEIGGRTWRTT